MSHRIASITNHLAPQTATDDLPVYRTELSPLSLLQRTVALYPNRPAFAHNGSVCNYAEFGRRVRQFALGLQKKGGIQPGERVAVLCPNTPTILEAHFAIPLVGAVLVCINVRLAQEEVEYILKASKSRMLFIDAEFMHLTRNWKSCGVRVVIPCEDLFGKPNSHLDRYEQFLADSAKIAALASWESFPPLNSESATIAINFTSGTTGKPKGVMTHYRGAYLNSLCLAIEMKMSCETNYLWIVPMFHASGWCFPWAVTSVGGCHTLLRKVDYTEIWRLINDTGITHYCAAPTVQLGITDHPHASPVAPTRRMCTMVAAAPPSPTLLASLLKLNITPIHVYGLTETYGPCVVCAWQPEWRTLDVNALAEKLSRQGHCFLAGDQIQVVDFETGVPVPSDGTTLGEVVIRGNLVMTGYLDDEAATREAFRGGVFHTGDVAVKHVDGYIELRDRKKDIIITGGENVSTIEVENALVAHPAVLEACIVSTPDDKWGERPVAYITLKEKNVDEAQLREDLALFLRRRLAGFKVPARIEIVMELPKTSTGKVQKFVLRGREWANAGKGLKRIN
ncbi:hypothetical protein HDU82_006772 [Entophlyctis luteolus]|nr:hypothetical protein HDU82_006772 [Entophlyctis luteolus]